MKNSHLFAVVSTVFLTSVGFANQNSACSSSIIEAVNTIAERAANVGTQEDLYQCAVGLSIQFCGTQDLVSQAQLTNACQRISSQSLGQSRIANPKIGVLDGDEASAAKLNNYFKNDVPGNSTLRTKLYLASGFQIEIEFTGRSSEGNILSTDLWKTPLFFGGIYKSLKVDVPRSSSTNNFETDTMFNSVNQILFVQRYHLEFGGLQDVRLSAGNSITDYQSLEKIFFDPSEHDDFEAFEKELSEFATVNMSLWTDSKIRTSSVQGSTLKFLELNLTDFNLVKMFLRSLY